MKFSKLLFLLLLGLFVISCNDVDDIPVDITCAQDAFTSGALVVNEGPFMNGAGSITMIDDNLGTISDGFARNNCDSLAGSILQSATVIGNSIAVVANLSNVIRILDANTLEEQGVISGLKLPRYIVGGSGDLAYVSQWGLDGVSGSVVEVNLSDYSIVREVATNSGPEELQLHNNMLYVPHNGGFASDSVVVVIDPTDMSIVKTLVTGTNPQTLAFDGDDLWVLNSGAFDFVDPTLNIPGSLVKIVNDQITKITDLSTGVSNLVLDDSADNLYWVDSAGIAKYNIAGDQLSATEIPGFFYDLAQHPGTGILYICDAKDFNSLGEILTYDPLTGAMGDSAAAGLIPGEVIFY